MPQPMPNPQDPNTQQQPQAQQAPAPQQNTQPPEQAPGMEGSTPDQSMTQGQDPNTQPQESQAPEKYSAQMLRRLHEDREILLQEYDEMLQHSEHEEINTFVKKKLQNMVREMDEIEDIFQQHHPELEPPGGGKEGQEETPVPEEEGGEGSVENQDTADSQNPPEEEPEEAAQAMRTEKKSLNGWGAYCKKMGVCPECGKTPCACGKSKALAPDETGDEEGSFAPYSRSREQRKKPAGEVQGLHRRLYETDMPNMPRHPIDESPGRAVPGPIFHNVRVGDRGTLHDKFENIDPLHVGREVQVVNVVPDSYDVEGRFVDTEKPVTFHGLNFVPSKEYKSITAISTSRGWVASVKGHHDVRGKAFRDQKSATLYARKMYSDDRWLKNLGFDVYYAKEARLRPSRGGQRHDTDVEFLVDENDSPEYQETYGPPGTRVARSNMPRDAAREFVQRTADNAMEAHHGPVNIRDYSEGKAHNPPDEGTPKIDGQGMNMNAGSMANPTSGPTGNTSPVGHNSMNAEEKALTKERDYELEKHHRRAVGDMHDVCDRLANKETGMNDILRNECYYAGRSAKNVISDILGEDTDQLENVDFSESLAGTGGVENYPSQFPGDLPWVEQEGQEQVHQKAMPDKVLSPDESLQNPKKVKLHHLKVINHAADFLMKMANERAFGRKHQNEAYLLYMALMQIVSDDPPEDSGDEMGEVGEKGFHEDMQRSHAETAKDRAKLDVDSEMSEESLASHAAGTHPDLGRIRQQATDRERILDRHMRGGKSFQEEQYVKSLQETFSRQSEQLANLIKVITPNGTSSEVKN